MPHKFDENRYDGRMTYRRCGRSGLKLPAISLGCWHNFGGTAPTNRQRDILYTAFDCGITHFDLANNYGPPFGSAERNVGRILNELPRDELVISTKAGYIMWQGPYGEWGSRKHVLASLNQSLKRLDLEYVDIFYSHRFDPDTPLEETLGALQTAIDQGKALYAGISSYVTEQTNAAVEICRDKGWNRILIHQPNYSMLNRWIEKSLVTACEKSGLGIIAFCPLYQGLLTDKYLKKVPDDSRASRAPQFLRPAETAPEVLQAITQLNEIAKQRGQSLAQMALAWILRLPQITSVLCGASSADQVRENCKALENSEFSDEELRAIIRITSQIELPNSLWASD